MESFFQTLVVWIWFSDQDVQEGAGDGGQPSGQCCCCLPWTQNRKLTFYALQRVLIETMQNSFFNRIIAQFFFLASLQLLVPYAFLESTYVRKLCNVEKFVANFNCQAVQVNFTFDGYHDPAKTWNNWYYNDRHNKQIRDFCTII